jgi:signal transduction histidine kinase
VIASQWTARSEGIRALFGQTGPILWANVMVAAILVATLWNDAAPAHLLAWFAVLSLVTLARTQLHREYQLAVPGAEEIERWGGRFVLASAISGLVWGAASILFFRPGGLSEIILTLAVGGMSAAAAGTMACHLPAFFAYFALALGPLLVRMLVEGDRIHLGTGALIAVFGLGIARVAMNNHATFQRAFRLGLSNAELAAELSHSQLDLEETNRTLEQRVLERSRELELQGEALRKAQRLEVAGKLAGGLAHDFNSLLTVVLNNAALLKESQSLDEQGKLACDEVLEAAQRGAALIRQLLAFSGSGRARPRVFSLNQLLEEWTALLERMFGAGTTVTADLRASPAHVLADPTDIEQVLVNLVANARLGAQPGGGLVLSTRSVSSNGEGELPAGRYVELTVQDVVSAAGKAERRGFAPYFLVDGEAQGSGLATVRAIVAAAGGQVLTDAGADHSARVRVYLPAQPEPIKTPVAPPVASASTAASATVLVVDDEPTLRSVIRRSLAAQGLTVLVAEDGERALAIAEAHPGGIDLLITDVVMPALSGPDLARRLRGRWPALSVLFISGYTFEQSLPVADGACATAYLSKPFDTKVLGEKVRTLLDG